MKALGWVLVLIVVAGGIILLTKKNEAEAPAAGITESMKVMGYEDGAYSIVPAESTITWSGSFLNGSRTHLGAVAVAEGAAVIEGAELASGTVTIDMNSITESNGSPVVDHLKSDDFFAVATYPTATFVVTSVSPREDISVGSLATGNLTIKGVTREVTIPIVVSGSADDSGITISGETTIDRSEWDVRYGSATFFDNLGDRVIDDMITISFSLSGERVTE